MRLQKFLFSPHLKQVTAVFMAALLISAPFPGGFAAPAEKINFNTKYGRIRESYSASSEKTIIHIQDAHCVYEAQKNIIGMIHDLYKNHNVSLVTLEGADGYFDFEELSTFPLIESRENVADYFLRKGRISGSEYLMIENQLPLSYRGAENRDLYIENYASFMSSLPKPDDPAVVRARDIADALGSLKKHMYNDALVQLDEQVQRYAEQQVSFGEYAQFLKEQADNHSIAIDSYKNLAAFYEVSEMETKIDFGKIHTELSNIINELTEIITKDELSQLLYKNLFYKLEKITPAEFFVHLNSLGASYNYSFSPFSNVTYYMEYLKIYDTINEIEILDEAKKLVREIQNQLYDSDDQRLLAQLTADSGILSKLLELKVTKNELNYYINNKDSFTAERFITFIKKHAPTYQVPFNSLNDFAVIAQRMPVLDDFYEIAAKRNEALIENTLAEMELEDTNTAILITGGFHTEGITEILRREGISYHVVSPVLTEQPTNDLYLARLAGMPTEMEELLTAERLSVPLVLGETELVEGQNSQQFKDVFKTLLDVDSALSELPDQLPADYQPSVTYLDAFSIRNFSVTDASGQPASETVKFLAFKALGKTYQMAVLPAGMRIDGAVGKSQAVAGRELVLIDSAAFVAAEQNPAREAIGVAANTVDYYLEAAAVAGNAAIPPAGRIPDLDTQLNALAQNNLIVRSTDGSGAVRPTFAYVMRSNISQAHIQPRVVQVDALSVLPPVRAYLEQQGITQIAAFSNHSILTSAEAAELNDNLITILQNGNYRLASGKNINAVVQDGIAQVFSTQDTAVKPFVPIPHSVFEAMVPEYNRVRLLSPIEAQTQGYIELGVVDGKVTVTLYRVDALGSAVAVQSYAVESPDATESDIFSLILQARQQAYQDNIGLLGYGNPDSGIAISFNNLDELMAVVNGNPVRQAALNVFAAIASLPALRELSRESIEREGITSVQDLSAYIQGQTPDVELPDLTCAACAAAVVHDSLTVGDIEYTREAYTDYAQFLLQMMLFIDARQRPGGIEQIDGQIFNSMYAMATAFQVAGRNSQAVSVVPAGQTLTAEERIQRLQRLLEQLPEGESIVLALRTREDKGHFITLRRTNQGYQVYDALAESFRDEQQAGITAITDNPQAMGGINYVLNTYLTDTYGTEAFTGAILAGQSIDATGQVLASLIENGVVRTMPRQEQFAVVGASPEVVSILVSAMRNISDDRILVAMRDLLDSLLINQKSIEEKYGEFASENYFERVLRVHGVETITPQLQQLLSLIKRLYSVRGELPQREFIRRLAQLFDRGISPATFYGLYGALGRRNALGADNPLASADPRALKIVSDHLSSLERVPTINELKSVYYWVRVFNEQGGAEAVRSLLVPMVPVLEYLIYTEISRLKERGEGLVTADSVAKYIEQSAAMYLEAKTPADDPMERMLMRQSHIGHPLSVSQPSLQIVYNHLQGLSAKGAFPAEIANPATAGRYWSAVFSNAGQGVLYNAEGRRLVQDLLLSANALYSVSRPAGSKAPFNGQYAAQVFSSSIAPFIVAEFPKVTTVASVPVVAEEPQPEEKTVPEKKPEDPLAVKKRAAIQEGASVTNTAVAMIGSMRELVVRIATSHNAHFSTINTQFQSLQQQMVRIENTLRRLSSDELQLVMTAKDKQDFEGVENALRELKQIITPLQARSSDNPMRNAPNAQAGLKSAWDMGPLRRLFDSLVSLGGDASFALDLKKSFSSKLSGILAEEQKARAEEEVVTARQIAAQPASPEVIALKVMLDEVQQRKRVTETNIISYGLALQYWEHAVFDHGLDGTYKTDLKALFVQQRRLIASVLLEAQRLGANNGAQTLQKLVEILQRNIAQFSTPEGAVMNRYSQDFLDEINQIGQALGLTEGQLVQFMGQGSFALVDRDGISRIEGSPRNALALISRIQNIPVELNRAKGIYHELIESITGQRPDVVSRIVSQLETAAENTPESRARFVLQSVFAERYNMDGQPLQALVREAVAKIFTNAILPPDSVSAFYAEPAVAEMAETIRNAASTADRTVYEQITASAAATPQESIRSLTEGMKTLGLTLPGGIEQAIVDNTLEQWFDTVFSTELMAAIELYNDLPLPQAVEQASRSEAVRRTIRRAQERAQLQNSLPRLTSMDFSFLVNDTVSHIIANKDTFYDAQGRPTRSMLDYIEQQGGISDTRTLGIAQLIQEYVADEQNVFVLYSLDHSTDTIEKIMSLYGISPAKVVIIDAERLRAENADTPILGLPAAIQGRLELGDGITLEMSDLVLIATDNDVARFSADRGAKVYLSPSGILPQNFTVDNTLALGFNVFQAATRMAQGEPQYGNLIISYVGEQNVFISELIGRIKEKTGLDSVTLEQLVNELGGLKALGELNRNDVEGIVLSFPERNITPDDIQSDFLNRLKAQRMVETSA